LTEILLLAALLADPRVCHDPAAVPRDARGEIRRSAAERQLFRGMYACPATGLPSGPCPGWSVDHVVPLACGGCDAPHNMQWLPNEHKSCAGRLCKDRWERRVYCAGGAPASSRARWVNPESPPR
jgi:hypothetical protein